MRCSAVPIYLLGLCAPKTELCASLNALLPAAASRGGIWFLEKVLQTSSNVSKLSSLYLGSSGLLFFNLIFFLKKDQSDGLMS